MSAANVTSSPNAAEFIVNEKRQATYPMSGWMSAVAMLFKRGYSGTITTAKLTGGGANGSMTFVNGVLVDQTAAT